MAKLALVYGMRLLPADEIASVGEAEVDLKSGKKAHVTMHLIEGGEQEIRNQLMQSLDAFFEFYRRSDLCTRMLIVISVAKTRTAPVHP